MHTCQTILKILLFVREYGCVSVCPSQKQLHTQKLKIDSNGQVIFVQLAMVMSPGQLNGFMCLHSPIHMHTAHSHILIRPRLQALEPLTVFIDTILVHTT